MADVENYQQRFLDLVKIFDSEPESHNKLYSNSHFRDDVRCRCGWSLKLNIKNCYRALHDTKKHYEKRASPLSTARAFRQYDEKHLLFGFYLKENTIIKLPKPSSVLRWTSPRHTINPPNIPPPTPSPVQGILEEVQDNSEKSAHTLRSAVESCVHLTQQQIVSSDFLSAPSRVENLISTVATESKKRVSVCVKKVISDTLAESHVEDSDEIRKVVQETTSFVEETRNTCRDLHSRAVKHGIFEVEESIEQGNAVIANQTSEEFRSREPPWLCNLKRAHNEGLIDELQLNFLKSFASSFTTAPTGRSYAGLTKTLYKLFQLSTSSNDYDFFRRIFGGPTGRTLRSFKFQVLSDIGPSVRNAQECESYFDLVSYI